MNPRCAVIPVALCVVFASCWLAGCSRQGSSGITSSQTAQEDSDQGKQGSKTSRSSDPVDDPTGREKQVSRPTMASIRSAMDARRFEDALEKVRSFLLAEPNHPEALYLAGECLFATDQPNRAVETLSLIPGEDPKYGMAAMGRMGEWYLSRGQLSDASQMFQQIIALHGDVPLAHSRLALIYNSQGQRFEAMPHLLTLARLQDITRRELGALITISDQCIVAALPGTTGTLEKPVEGDLRRARQLAMTFQWDECLQWCRQLRRSFPRSTAIAAFYGVALARSQQIPELTQWHADLPDGIEKQPEYWAAMAHWLEFQGKCEQAIRCASESLARDPTNHLMYETLARSLYALEKPDVADEALDRANQLQGIRKLYRETLDENFDDSEHGSTASEDHQAPARNLGQWYARIAEGMLKLNRPWESLGWLTWAKKTNPNAPAIGRVEVRLRSYEPPSDLIAWNLCGISIEQYPMPAEIGHNSSVAADSSSSDSVPSGALDQDMIQFRDVAEAVGMRFQYDPGNPSDDGSYLLHHTMGGGIAVIDFDLDGWPDVYFSQGGGPAMSDRCRPNVMFRNLGGSQFADTTEATGTGDRRYGQGVTTADLNQDGFPDLIVANIGNNTVYQNNGDGTFTRKPLQGWDSQPRWSSLVAAADLNGDHLPDLFECNYIDDPNAMRIRCTPQRQACAPAEFRPAADRILIAGGDGSFQTWPASEPVESSRSYGLGVMIANMDAKYGNDVFVANDTRENAFWVSYPADGTEDRFHLRNEARMRGCATGPWGGLLGCMGIAAGDFDRNGTFDMFVTNFYDEPVNLFLQHDSATFIDATARYQLQSSSQFMVGFGTQACDFDRDGWLDLVVLNGHAVDRRNLGEPLQMMPQLYRGRPHAFDLDTPNDPFWMRPTIGRTLTYLDWNRDGKPDLIANHLDRPANLLQNESRSGHWIRLRLVGTISERDATGAKVTLDAAQQKWTSWVTAGDGYFCTNESTLDFGIGQADQVDRVTVQWPSGITQQIDGLAVDQEHLIIESP